MSSSGESSHLTSDAITAEARTLLGEQQVVPLFAISNEAYLQQRLDSFRYDPNTMLSSGGMLAGSYTIISRRRALIEAQLQSSGHENKVVVASGMETSFRIGFGMVDKILNADFVNQADKENISLKSYETWAQAPLPDRVAEIHNFLSLQDAQLLAINFLEPDRIGTIANFASNLTISVPRVTGEEPFILSNVAYPEIKTQLMEGALAALYLTREHQIGQEFAGMEVTDEKNPIDPTKGSIQSYYHG